MPTERLDSGQGRRALEATGARTRRAELAVEESRALRGSSTIAAIIGIAWVVLVWFGPTTDVTHLLPPEERPIEVRIENPPPPPPPPPSHTEVQKPKPDEPKPPTPKPDQAALEAQRDTRRAAAAAAAFGGGGGSAPAAAPVGDVSNVLRGTDIVHGAAPTPGAAMEGKAVLAYGQGGQGSRTPGRTDFGGGGGAAGGGGTGVGSIGGIGAGAGIGHAGVSVSAPKAIESQGVGTVGRDMEDLGTTVRNRRSQLSYCYVEYGLKSDPTLAGSVTLSLSISGTGEVTNAAVTNRTWSGEGASAAESCILDKVRAWKFATSTAGAGTYAFAFQFTK